MEGRSIGADLYTVLAALPPTAESTGTPALVVICGLPGTGKSYLAHRIAGKLGAVIVESDFIRKLLFPKPDYTGPESVWVHRIAHIAVERLLRSGKSVIYDSTALAEWHRQQSYRLAERARANLVVVRTVAPESVIRKRLERRQADHPSTDYSDATWEVYQHLKPKDEPVRHPHIVVNSARDVNRAIGRILRAARRPRDDEDENQ